MSAIALILRLRSAGVRLAIVRGGLAVDAPRGVLTSRDRTEIARHASTIVRMLREAAGREQISTVGWGGTWREALEERAAIMEVDGLVLRDEAARAAKADIQAQRIAFARPYLDHPVVAAAVASLGPIESITVRLPDGERVQIPLSTLSRGGRA